MASLQEFERAKRNVAQAEAEKQRAQGALDAALKSLKKDFGCDTLEEAEKKLTKLKRQEAEAEEQFQTAFADWNQKWEGK